MSDNHRYVAMPSGRGFMSLKMKKIKLYCKLVNQVITDEGDFIPKGTPCEVIRWSREKITVRSVAYMYCDDDKEDDSGQPIPNVNDNLLVDVLPSDLEYSNHIVKKVCRD